MRSKFEKLQDNRHSFKNCVHKVSIEMATSPYKAVAQAFMTAKVEVIAESGVKPCRSLAFITAFQPSALNPGTPHPAPLKPRVPPIANLRRFILLRRDDGPVGFKEMNVVGVNAKVKPFIVVNALLWIDSNLQHLGAVGGFKGAGEAGFMAQGLH